MGGPYDRLHKRFMSPAQAAKLKKGDTVYRLRFRSWKDGKKLRGGEQLDILALKIEKVRSDPYSDRLYLTHLDGTTDGIYPRTVERSMIGRTYAKGVAYGLRVLLVREAALCDIKRYDAEAAQDQKDHRRYLIDRALVQRRGY